jgi:hypothetical protein
LSLIALAVWSSQCRATLYTGTLDQSALADVTGGYTSYTIFTSGGVSVQHAQTFHVGLSGILSQVDLQVSRVGPNAALVTQPLFLAIQSVNVSGQPSGITLAGFSIPASSVPVNPGFSTWVVPVDVTGATLSVTAGTFLSLVLSSTVPSVTDCYGWVSGANYSAGNGWGRSTGAWNSQGLDFGFQTYVVPVPEPGPAGMFLSGAAALVWWRGLRNRSQLRERAVCAPRSAFRVS